MAVMTLEAGLCGTEQSCGSVPSAVPDLAVFCASLLLILVFCAFQKHVVGPLSVTYGQLSFATRYDWDQRVLNLLFQIAQTIFNLYILFVCTVCADDPLYGYTPASHVGFLCIAAFYAYDAVLLLHHPSEPHATFWVCHHLFATGLLLWLTIVQKTSARPASTFLISSAGHIANEVRWFMRKTKTSRKWSNNMLGISCDIVIFVACVVPPPHLVLLSARKRQVRVVDMFSHLMRWPCVVGFWIIWIPHCALWVIQMRKTAQHWDGSNLQTTDKRLS